MKGKAKIELINKNTGKVKTVIKKNLVTNAMDKIFNRTGMRRTLLDTSLNTYSGNSPLNLYAMGGIILYGDTQVEDVENIDTGTNIIGRAGYNYSDTGTTFGRYVTEESTSSDTSFANVFQFDTSKANGTIKSISLTSNQFGGGSTTGALINTSFIVGNSDLTNYIASTNASNWNFVCKEEDYLVFFMWVSSTDTGYGLSFGRFFKVNIDDTKLLNNVSGEVTISADMSSTDNIIDNTITLVQMFTTEDEQDARVQKANYGSFTENDIPTGLSIPGLEKIHCACFMKYSSSTISYATLLIYENLYVKQITLTNIVGSAYSSYNTIIPCIINGYDSGTDSYDVTLYLYQATGYLRKVTINNNYTNIQYTDYAISGISYYNRIIGDKLYSTGSSVGTNSATCTVIDITTMQQLPSRSFSPLRTIIDNIFYLGGYSGSGRQYLSFGTMLDYNATILNLDEPIEKTEEDILKITYTVNFE